MVHDGWVENLLKNMIENETFVLVKAIVNKEAILTSSNFESIFNHCLDIKF
jgi:hypothetical protein